MVWQVYFLFSKVPENGKYSEPAKCSPCSHIGLLIHFNNIIYVKALAFQAVFSSVFPRLRIRIDLLTSHRSWDNLYAYYFALTV